MSTAAGDVNWRATGEHLGLQTAREVGRLHGVPLDVVLKGFHVPAGVQGRFDSAEDHVVVKNAGHHVIKFADYSLFTDVCVPRNRDPLVGVHTGLLTVVIMPYADLSSCKKIDELSKTSTPQLHGYYRIEIANPDLLIRKLRATAAVDDEACRVRDLGAQIQSLRRGLFPANKYPRSSAAHGLRPNREIAMERLMKAHLDAKQYGDAHDLLLLLNKRKHDAIFTFYDPCRGTGDVSPKCMAKNKKGMACRLEEYRRELEEKFGSAPLDQWPERADVLRMEAQRKFERELVDARRQVIDIVETAVQQLDSIAEQLMAAATQPSLLGFGM